MANVSPTMQTNRQYALKLVNKSVALLTRGGVSLGDLPDSYTLCNGLDELEEVMHDKAGTVLMSELLDIAQDIAAQLLEEEGFPV
jgi:hypothetical protein